MTVDSSRPTPSGPRWEAASTEACLKLNTYIHWGVKTVSAADPDWRDLPYGESTDDWSGLLMEELHLRRYSPSCPTYCAPRPVWQQDCVDQRLSYQSYPMGRCH
jgi:hypothetical protein